MFEGILTDALVFKKLVESFKDLIVQVHMEIDESGVHFSAMDESRVAMLSLKIHSHSFAKFVCTKPQ